MCFMIFKNVFTEKLVLVFISFLELVKCCIDRSNILTILSLWMALENPRRIVYTEK